MEEKNYELIEVPTQHVLAIRTPEEEKIGVEQAITLILNKLNKIEKLLA